MKLSVRTAIAALAFLFTGILANDVQAQKVPTGTYTVQITSSQTGEGEGTYTGNMTAPQINTVEGTVKSSGANAMPGSSPGGAVIGPNGRSNQLYWWVYIKDRGWVEVLIIMWDDGTAELNIDGVPTGKGTWGFTPSTCAG